MAFDKMNCIKSICLYLREYLSDEQFEDLFSAQICAFQTCLEEDIYLDIVFTNFHSKEEKISLRTKLYQYVMREDSDLYENTNDVFVEHMIAEDPEGELVQIVRNKQERKAEICIDCRGIHTSSELIRTIKQSLQFPAFCGAGWDAVADLICDVILPQKIVFLYWGELETRLPRDAYVLKKLFERYLDDLCLIVYE